MIGFIVVIILQTTYFIVMFFIKDYEKFVTTELGGLTDYDKKELNIIRIMVTVIFLFLCLFISFLLN